MVFSKANISKRVNKVHPKILNIASIDNENKR